MLRRQGWLPSSRGWPRSCHFALSANKFPWPIYRRESSSSRTLRKRARILCASWRKDLPGAPQSSDDARGLKRPRECTRRRGGNTTNQRAVSAIMRLPPKYINNTPVRLLWRPVEKNLASSPPPTPALLLRFPPRRRRQGGAPFLGGKVIIQVACGSYHTIVLDDEGRVYPFGRRVKVYPVLCIVSG